MRQRIRWAIITTDKKCLLRRYDAPRYPYTLTLVDEEFCPGGGRRAALFNDKNFEISELDIVLSDKVQQLYGTDSVKQIIERLEFTKAISEVKDDFMYERGKKIRQVDDNIIIGDELYLIMTEDKKCIIRGRKTTRYILATIEEACGNYKVFTCRQPSVIVRGMNECFAHSRVEITDNVKELYNVDSRVYSPQKGLPKLIAVKAQVQYKAQL